MFTSSPKGGILTLALRGLADPAARHSGPEVMGIPTGGIDLVQLKLAFLGHLLKLGAGGHGGEWPWVNSEQTQSPQAAERDIPGVLMWAGFCC